MQKFILVHHHIFKNAGSTIDTILEKNFGVNFGKLESNSSSGQITQESFLKFLGENKNIKAIASHHFHAQEFKSDTHIFFDILFLRNPLDRLRSIYDFYRSNDALNDPFVDSAKKMCLREFLEYLLKYHPHQVNDVQVNILANHGKYCRPPDRIDLSIARARLRKASVLGTLEMIDQSLIAAKYFLTPAFGELDIGYKAQNTSSGRKTTLENRLEEFSVECGPHLYKQLVTMNQLDLRLLDYSNEEVHRRLKLIPNISEKIARFKNEQIR